MYLKHANFNHEEEDLNKALCFTDEVRTRCRERIFFAGILGYVLRTDLYGNDDNDEIPRELRTLTGTLSRCLSLITDNTEYDFTLLHFMKYHDMVLGAVGHYKEHVGKDKDEETEDSLKNEIAKLVKKIIDKKRPSDEEGSISIEDMYKRIETVKKCKGSFNRYMKIMGYQEDDHSNVDDLLKKTFTENE